MNPFFRPGMQGMLPPPAQNIMNIMRQVQQIKQHPNQLADLLKRRGMIDDNQVKDIQKMGNNYEQIGHYLMNNGKMPTNIQQYESQVNQVQNMMNPPQNVQAGQN